jgi:DNA-binding transcriptional LysR family regulator
MNELQAFRTFAEVARQGSFAAAAKSLGISTTSVSRVIKELEDWLGTPVLRRTPRAVALTDPGEQLLEHCVDIIGATDLLRNNAREWMDEPSGTLRIAAAPFPARRRIAPILPDYLERYPGVRLELLLDDRPADIIAEGIDVAVRFGVLENSSLKARKCGEFELVLTASPAFIEKNGTPSSLNNVPSYPCLVDSVPGYGRRWPVGRRINVDGPVVANDGDFIRQVTIAGMGISLLPKFFVEDDLADGRLVELFPGQIDVRFGMYCVYQSTGKITAAARAFIDFMVEQLDPHDAAA